MRSLCEKVQQCELFVTLGVSQMCVMTELVLLVG